MRERMKKLMTALLVATAFLTASIPARAEGPARRTGESPGMEWVTRILDWLGLHPQRSTIWEASSANIDPDGQPNSGGSGGTSPSSDSSAHIDPNG